MRFIKFIGPTLICVFLFMGWSFILVKISVPICEDDARKDVQKIVEAGIVEAYELGYRDGVERFYTSIENDCVCILNKTLILDALYGIQFKFENGELEKIEDK